MKALKISMPIGIIALLMALSSCDSEGLNGSVEPANYIETEGNFTHNDEYQPKVIAGEFFHFSSPVFLAVGKVDPSVEGGNEGKLSIRGAADSYMYKWGSWMVELDLVYNSLSNEISGYYKCIFPDLGDEVIFEVNSKNGLEQTGEVGDQPVYSVMLDAQILRGTGSFQNMGMDEGQVILKDALNLLQPGHNEISAVCSVQGNLYEVQ